MYYSGEYELTSSQCDLIVKTWEKLSSETHSVNGTNDEPGNPTRSPFWVEFFDLFYTELFSRAPQAKCSFSPNTAMHLQAQCLVCLMSHLVKKCDDLRTGASRDELRALGKTHAHILNTEMYFVLAQTIISSISCAPSKQGELFTAQTRAAWVAAVAALIEYMSHGKVRRQSVHFILMGATHSADDITAGLVSPVAKRGFVARARMFFRPKRVEEGVNVLRTASLDRFDTEENCFSANASRDLGRRRTL
eukprot:comp24822_c0_seq1/m.46891 comp24822_c0_seq1/g.46891  ORF comp24822_c0_seq1/g.46891 comp24822_c0_seq1/m.46891 type:complete len:249 (-) comp24822_c0_seq1:347-1093(-)